LVSVSMVCEGDVANWDDARRADLAAAIASEAGVSTDAVTIRVESASVRITAEVTANETQSAEVQTALAAALATPEEAPAFFSREGVANVTVESVDAVTVAPAAVVVAPPPPSSPPPASPQTSSSSGGLSGGVVAVVVIAIVLVVCLVGLFLWKRERDKPLPPPPWRASEANRSKLEMTTTGEVVNEANRSKLMTTSDEVNEADRSKLMTTSDEVNEADRSKLMTTSGEVNEADPSKLSTTMGEVNEADVQIKVDK